MLASNVTHISSIPPRMTRISSIPPGGARISTFPPGGARISTLPPGGARISTFPPGGARISSIPPGGARISTFPPGGVRVSSVPPRSREIPKDVAARFVPVIRQAALRVARRLPAHICVDDLVGAGFVGLVDAYRRYEPSRCDRFDAYAEVRIRGAMLDELRSYDPLSRDLRALANRSAQAVRGLQHHLGRQPTEAEIASELGIPVDAYRTYAAKMAVGGTVSLDAASQREEAPLEIGDMSASPADEMLLLAQSKQALGEAMDQLAPRLRSILELYYRDELTLREIGQRLGVTESRVCQLHGEAVQKLRAIYSLRDADAARGSEQRARRAPRSAKMAA